MTKIILAAFLLTAGFACKSNSQKHDEELTTRTTYGDSYAKNSEETEYKNADNTAMNKRDASGATLTPMDQTKGSKADLEITRKIRETITDEDSLSIKAQNVKIITLQGLTTLRGPVDSFNEKSKVEQLARRAGARKIDNQLEVTIK
jgi:hypothetical protein